MYCSPLTTRCTPASSASWPVTGGSGLTPPVLRAGGGGGRLAAAFLGRGYRAARHAVVGGVDADDVVLAEGGNGARHGLVGLLGPPAVDVVRLGDVDLPLAARH